MNTADAIEQLNSTDSARRLEAARYLQFWATPADISDLRAALQRESVVWVRRALEQGLRRLGDERTHRIDLDDLRQNEEESTADVAALARARIARTLVHELEPIVGVVDYYASTEIKNYDNSSTKHHVRRLTETLGAIQSLAQIATRPQMVVLDIAPLVGRIVNAHEVAFGLSIAIAGPHRLVLTTDQRLLDTVLSNGLKNACEAVSEAEERTSSVSVLFGGSDREVFFTVLDNGVGLPLGTDEQLFEMGTSTKADHLGFGLAHALEAATALGASLSLSSTGLETRFELVVPMEGD
jgi:signal transduction histidine kinase